MLRKRSLATQLLSCSLILLLSAPLAEARYQPKPGFNLFKVEDDIQAGKEYSVQVEKEMPLVKDAAVNAYVQRLGQRLASKAPAPQYPYTFKVINQKEINAFALPGGPVYVNLGTIQAADTEAQLAGVIGHEIGHVVMRHSTSQASKQNLLQIGAALIAGRAGGGISGQLAQLGIGLGAGSILLKYSRAAENQADLVGAGIIHDAGYNPQAMVEFFHKLEAEGGGRGPQFLSDHPNPGNRAEAVAREVSTLPKANYQGDSAEFKQIKQKVAGMKGLTAQEIAQQKKAGGGQNGGQTGGPVTRSNDALPSTSTVAYEGGFFTILRPQNWQPSPSQSGGVTLAHPAGVSGGNIAYGTIVERAQASGSLQEATAALTKSILQGNPQMRQLGEGEDFRLNGTAARSVVLQGPSPIANETERDWLVTLQRSDGSLAYVIFIAPESDFNKLQPTFEKMLRSWRMK